MKAKRPASEDGSPHVSLDVVTRRMCERLRRLRKQRGWTLEQLAAVSGVSRSMLIQIERGRANPALAVAFRIVRAFGRSLADLVDGPGAASTITLLRATDSTYRFRSDDTCRIRTLCPMQLEKDVEFYEVWLAPGGALKSAAHFTGTRELLMVNPGSVAVTSGKDSCAVAAGCIRNVIPKDCERSAQGNARQRPGEIMRAQSIPAWRVGTS